MAPSGNNANCSDGATAYRTFAIAVALKPVNVLFHALLRTPRQKHRRLLRWRPHGRAESDNGVTVASMTGPALI